MRSWPAFAALLVAVACEPPPESPQATDLGPRAQPAVERPLIEFAGCRHLVGDSCHLRAQPGESLRVWIDVQAQAALRVEVDGEPVELERVAVDGGQRLRFEGLESARSLRIEGVDPPWSSPFELQITRDLVPAVVAVAHQHALDGELQVAVDLLRAALPDLEGPDRLAALQKLRRVLLALDAPAALRRTQEAATLARSLGRTRDFADCASAAAHMTMADGELAAAREWTRKLELAAVGLPEARVWARFYAGVLASRTGDLGGSVRDLEQAHRLARRLDMFEEMLGAAEQLATGLAELGRGDEALLVASDTLESAREPGVSCRDRARALGNVAWIKLLLAEAGHDHDPPRALLEEQLAAVDAAGECPNPSNAALVNLAIVALAEHEPEEAWERLNEARAAGLPRYLRPWVAELEAQIGVATGRDALIPALVRLPDSGGLGWMALVRHAQTLEGFSLDEAAIDAYIDAEALLDDMLGGVGVNVGQELFLAGRQASAVGLVDLLIRTGAVEEAFCRARLARGRALRTVDRAAKIASLTAAQRSLRDELLYAFLELQTSLAAGRRDDWSFSAPEQQHRRSRRAEREAEAAALLDEALRLVGAHDSPSGCEQLPAAGAGVVTLLQFPRPESGSWVFVADAEGVSVRAAPEPGTDDDRSKVWATEVLEPLGERLAAAQLIRVMPTGSGWSLAFHALPFEDGTLLDLAPVIYSLDLPARERPRAAAAHAVIIANPSEDLPYAREEADEVGRRLAASGWSVEHHSGAQATRARLAESLGEATLLHYAGHGVHGGVDGWGASLLLHDGDRLGVTDIVALPRVPSAVVLLGCDTATVDEDTLGGGMNLGRAFVLAGADWVLAANGKVDDALARELAVSLYAQLAGSTELDGARALRQAQLRLQHTHTEGWAAFRVIGP